MKRVKLRPVGDRNSLLLKPIKNIDVSCEGSEGLHQVRIFQDVTPTVGCKVGLFVLLVNQQQRDGMPLHPGIPAWYTGKLAEDAVPVKFLDIDKLYSALADAKRMQAEYEGRQQATDLSAHVQSGPERDDGVGPDTDR